jgi:hypothetical protein
MKTASTKLKKLKTRTVYGFRRHQASGNNFMDTTTTNGTTTATATTTTSTMIF